MRTVDDLLRIESVQRGLITPEDQLCGCGDAHRHHGTKGPSINELLFASRQHRNPEMAKLHRDFFKALAAKASEYESKMLEALGLPKIEQVRRAIIAGQEPADQGSPWVYHDSMELKLKAIIREWLEDILGPEYSSQTKSPGDIADFSRIKWVGVRFMAMAFDVEARQQYDALRQVADEGTVLTLIMADPNKEYFRAMLRDAGKRITTELAVSRLKVLRNYLFDMAYNGKYPLEVARKLHDVIGEGAAWYWQRIARSEATLAQNLAFDRMAAENGTKYEEWDAGPGCCIICAWFDGKVWRTGEGPQPVSSTHPHCMCARIATYGRGGSAGGLQPKYDRPSPYDKPWSKEEIQRIRDDLKTRRSDFDALPPPPAPPPIPPIPPPAPAPPPLPPPLPPAPAPDLSFKPVKTTKEGEEWLQKRFPHLKAKFRLCDIEVLNENLRAIDKLGNEWPEVMNRLTGIYVKSMPVNLYGQYDPTYREIYLNMKYYRNKEYFQLRMTENARDLWHPASTGTLDSVFIHEFGHAVDYYYKRIVAGKFYGPLVRADGTGSLSDLFYKLRNDVTKLGDRILSSYAMKNADETIAEAFAELKLGGPGGHACVAELDKMQKAMKGIMAEVGNNTYTAAQTKPWAMATPEEKAAFQAIMDKIEEIIRNAYL